MSVQTPSIPSLSNYAQHLMTGDRAQCRRLIEQAFSSGVTAYDLLTQLIWPTMESLQTLHREDRIGRSVLGLATRLNRSITDQVSGRLVREPDNGKRVLIFCGNDEPEELGGQICADLFESVGWTVRFAGGGVPDDEVLQMIGEIRPDLLVMFGTLPSGVPAVRHVQGTCGIDGDELHLHPFPGAEVRSAVARGAAQHLGNLLVVGGIRQKEIDESRPRDFRLGHRGAVRQRAHQGFRQLARILAGRLGETHRQVAGEVAVLRIAGVLHFDCHGARRGRQQILRQARQRLFEQ